MNYNNAKAKIQAAKEAVKYVEDDMIIGMGSGTTIAHAVSFLHERIQNEGLKIKAIPTSSQSFFLLRDNKIPITTLNEYPDVDLAIDGADEVDQNLNLIKGGGAALTQEKIVDSSAKKLIIIVDDSKMVDVLGTFPLPVEVIPCALTKVVNFLKEFTTEVIVRNAVKKLGPVVTDNGNYIVDARFNKIKDPYKLEIELNTCPGIVENGLFLDMTDIVLVGLEDSVKKITK
ncbi:MAG: ribose-5-phosphate isomerase RpiA [Candidatus Lokiarchaeota archaeon]|nr:ribose-5-phosphate isomerase RpiA [Candidatus Lokiarchaeota archaeon]